MPQQHTHMKNTLLTLTIIALASLAVPSFTHAEDAKEAKGVRWTPEERLKNMKEQLGLTDEQTAQVKVVLDKRAEERRAIREDKALSQDDRRSKMQELRKADVEEMKGILTPEQQEKMKEMRKGRKDDKPN